MEEEIKEHLEKAYGYTPEYFKRIKVEAEQRMQAYFDLHPGKNKEDYLEWCHEEYEKRRGGGER